jgi:HSP20 family protein
MILITFVENRMDLREDEQTNLVTASFELPGLRKEDVHVDVHNGTLSVTGESKAETERQQNGYAIRERRYGKFARSLQLPQGVKVS